MKVTLACLDIRLYVLILVQGSAVLSKNGKEGSGSPSTPFDHIPLRFTFLTTDGDEGCVQYAQVSIPALQMAVEDINADSSVLPRFQLEYNLVRLPKVNYYHIF